MNAVTNNQNKKKISFILEDEVLGMAAEDKNVLINAEQNKKNSIDDDEIVEQLTYIQLSSLFKFNADNLPEDIAEHDDDFEVLCDNPEWKVKCYRAYCAMQTKIREKKCEIENDPKFRTNALRYYNNLNNSNDPKWFLKNWNLRVNWAIEDEEKFKTIGNKFNDAKFMKARLKSSLKSVSRANLKKLAGLMK